MTPPTECRYDGCTTIARGLGYCPGHYRQVRLGQPLRPTRTFQSNVGKTCSVPECQRAAAGKGLCASHMSQIYRGVELTPLGSTRKGRKPLYAGVSCKFEGCDKKAESRGWCTGHYAQTARGVEMTPLGKTRGSKAGTALCGFETCDRRAAVRGLCSSHNAQKRRGVELHALGVRPPKVVVACQSDGCDLQATRKGWCDVHYRRALRTGSPDRSHFQHEPGRRLNLDSGYVSIKRPGHPEARDSGWGAEHRIVMSDLLGRPLFKNENVHHRNGQRHDNRPSNLELWVKWQPAGQRASDLLAWADEIRARYGNAPAEVLSPSGEPPAPMPEIPLQREALVALDV